MSENEEAGGLPINVAVEAAAAAGRHGAGTITWERDMYITLEEFSTAREDALYSELRGIGIPESMSIIISQPSAQPKDQAIT